MDKILKLQTSIYYGVKTPAWIREKIDAKAGDSVTVGGITRRHGYGYVSRRRVYNGTILCYDGEKWIVLDGGKK